ncbi:MAG: hypothetical protein JO250_20000 [Armatimonadetes bacterium]|nr:hypothetical protein [Armatimonadota bacterium]
MQDMPAAADAEVFVGERRWNVQRPQVLVVCCSDGRLQECMDEFLQERMGVHHYDRFYAPGGPGALAISGYEFLRAEQYRDDCAFLLRAHGVQDLILIFHGPAPDGPEEAVCAHYRRILPHATPEQIRAQQAQDMEEVLTYLKILRLPVRVHGFRAEVLPSRQVRFAPLTEDQ